MILSLIMLVQAAAPAPASDDDLARLRAAAAERLSAAPRRCDGTTSGEVLVCGPRDDSYRLPLPVERAVAPADRSGGASALAAITPHAPCGIFEGQRRCNKADATEFGYGEGRDPITAVIRIVTRLADADAD